MEHAAARIFFAQVVALAREAGWVSDEHFSVDGTYRSVGQHEKLRDQSRDARRHRR